VTELPATQLRLASRVSPVSGRLFLLELSAGRIHSMNPDGSNEKTIVSDYRNRDGIVVNVEASHILCSKQPTYRQTVLRLGSSLYRGQYVIDEAFRSRSVRAQNPSAGQPDLQHELHVTDIGRDRLAPPETLTCEG